MTLTANDLILPCSAMVSTLSRESIVQAVHQALDGGSFTTSTLSANRAYYWPMVLPRPCVLYKFFGTNGATVDGNVDIGLYRQNYTKVLSVGPTAMAGASVVQWFDVANTYIPAGAYYLAHWSSSNTATFGLLHGGTYIRRSVLHLKEDSLTGGLPTTMTPVAIAGTQTVSMVGFSTIPTF